MAVSTVPPHGACPDCGSHGTIPVGASGGRRRCFDCERVFSVEWGEVDMSAERRESDLPGVDDGFRKSCSCGALSTEIHRCDDCEQDLVDSERIVRVAVTGGAA